MSSCTKNRYQISICQDGKFAATFDTVNLQIRILENTDHRSFKSKNDKDSSPDHSESDKIDKTIAHFKINNDLTIKEFYDPEIGIKSDGALKDEDKFRWSFDISNLREDRPRTTTHLLDRGAPSSNLVDKYSILVAVSCINLDEDMRGTKEKENENDTTKRDYKDLDVKKVKYEINDNTTIININEADKGTAEMLKRTAIYRLKLGKKSKESNESEEKQKKETKGSYHVLSEDVDCFYSDSVSGICKFVDVTDKSENNVEEERFIILNFHGIYNFDSNKKVEKFTPFTPQENFRINLREKFEYPKSIRRELDNWYTKDTKEDCMRRLRSCIYDKYFLVTQYKNDMQSLEVYNLAKMELVTTAKKVENKEKFVRRYNYDTFSISKLQLCFTRGINHVMLYDIENGLQVASKNFDDIEKIHLLEFFDSYEKILIIGRDSNEELKFIIWDLYNTDKFTPITLDECSMKGLDQTLGNILYVDDKGNVTSVLKKIENKLKELEEKESGRKAKCIECNNDEHNNDGSNSCKYNKYYNEDTIPNFDKVKQDIISNFKKVADDIEPWVLDNYEKNSYCLYYNKEGTKTEFLQLIVGRTTVQIWHHFRDQPGKNDKLPNKGDPFLEYIWTNEIPVNQESDETRLRIKEFKYGSKLNSEKDESNKYGSKYKSINFSLKVCWDKKNKENEMVIKWKDVIGTFKPVIHACKALKHLNKHYKCKSLVDHYNRVHKYEEIVTYVKHIVWKFAKHNPEQFKRLDFRHNFMKNLILGDCNQLIKYILFGDEENIDNKNVSSKENEKCEREKIQKSRHIPKNISWPGEEKFIDDDDLEFIMKYCKLQKSDIKDIKPENNMELAIYYCQGRELKDTIIIAYFLEYYSGHATDCAGWMCTVSKALPLLFKYNYDDFARKLFHKECFANQGHFSAQDPDAIIPEKYLERHNNNIQFKAFRPIVKLNSDQQEHSRNIIYKIFKSFQSLKNVIYKRIDNIDNDLGKSPLALRVVPLPGVTINDIPKKKAEYSFKKIVLDLFCFIFIPRWYQIGRHDKNKLSPFSRMVLYENNDDIYDNPATEAIIDFRWQEARNFFWLLFIQFFIFAICFGAVSWEYLNHNAISGNSIVILTVIFYYLAIYQFTNEVLLLNYSGPRKYFSDIFNIVDLISIILSVTVMSIMIRNFQLSDGFGSVETVDTGLIVGISFSILFLWIELIFYLRILSSLGIYIYYFVVIVKTVFPFFLFMLIVIFAFGHTMFFLLRNPNNIDTKDTTFSGNATNTLTNETLNIKLKSDFDPNSRTDNPFSFLPATITAAYFWINGNWIQRDEFDFWAVDVFTLIISIVLTIFLQNMLIAYMSDVFTSAVTKSRQTLLKHRAQYIADYEALRQIHFWHYDPEPKYIYYFGQSKSFENWYEIKKGNQGAIYKSFEEKSTFTRRIFKEIDNSILVYDNDEIKNTENNIIKYLDENFKSQSNDDETEKINHLKYFVKQLFDSK